MVNFFICQYIIFHKGWNFFEGLGEGRLLLKVLSFYYCKIYSIAKPLIWTDPRPAIPHPFGVQSSLLYFSSLYSKGGKKSQHLNYFLRGLVCSVLTFKLENKECFKQTLRFPQLYSTSHDRFFNFRALTYFHLNLTTSLPALSKSLCLPQFPAALALKLLPFGLDPPILTLKRGPD